MGTGHSRGATPISSKRGRLYPQPRCGQATRRTLSLSQVRRPCGPEYPIPITGDLRQDLLDCPTVPQRTPRAAARMPFCPAPRGSIQPLLPALGSHSPQLALPAVMRLLAPVISSISMDFANKIICAGRRQASGAAQSRPIWVRHNPTAQSILLAPVCVRTCYCDPALHALIPGKLYIA